MKATTTPARARGAKPQAKRSAPVRASGKREESQPAKPYQPTEREKAAIASLHARQRAHVPAPSLKRTDVGKDKVPHWNVDHPDPKVGGTLLFEALGLTSSDAYTGYLTQIINAAVKGREPDAEQVNQALGLVREIQPRDGIEAMLAAQMVAVHSATMKLARSLNHVDTIPQQDSASNAFNKLARTFAMQLDALNRHRGKGQQAIRVEHVTVNGGQAIVGSNIHPQGVGVSANSEGQPHAKAIAHAPVTPLPSAYPEREAVPQSESAGS